MDAGFWVDVAWKVATVLAVAFYVPVTRSLDRLGGRIETAEKDLNGFGARVTRVEEQLKAQPGTKEIGEVHEKINEVAKDLANLCGTVESNETLLRAIHQHLMNHK
jgi:hypothetical protein